MSLAVESPFGIESTDEKLSDISEEDFQVDIIDEDTLQLENLIQGNGLSYSWIIQNYRNGKTITADDFINLEENYLIEFTYEDIEMITFQAIVEYDGMKYTSNEFAIDSDGAVYRVSEEITASAETVDLITRDVSDIVSLAYIGFLVMLVLLYYIVPKRIQWMVLLGASIIFYTLSGVHYIIFILVSSWVIYWMARKISARRLISDPIIKAEKNLKARKQLKAELQKANRELLIMALIGSLGVLAVIKYSAFLVSNINLLTNWSIPMVSLLMPLGLSFYTFMLIAYVVDVYRGKYVAEESFSRFFLYISFFPHVSQGPIARYDEVGPQLREQRSFDIDNLCFAAQRILWGFFVKLVLADRLAILVSAVYDNYETQSWAMLIIGSLAYSIQIYADFYSSMEIAIGSAQLFGIKLGENFLRPYFATNMPDFWRRWHVSLGTWFKDYVFYPISISKRVMKLSVDIRKKWGSNAARILAATPPIMGVWILTGLWHGSSWKFVAWGLFHGLLILMSTAFSQNVQNVLTRIGVRTESHDYKILQMVKVFLLCTIGRVFFRADSIAVAFSIFKNTLTLANPSDALIDFTSVALDAMDYKIIVLSILLLLIVSCIQEKIGSVRELLSQSNVWIRWTIWILLILSVMVFGIYGVGTTPIFIYDSF